jgi:Fe2+ transport system protein B
MIIEILLVVDLFLWFLSLLPIPQATAFNWAASWLAWIAAVLLTLFIFLPGMRG